MSNKIADDHQHAVEIFWHNYLSILDNPPFRKGPKNGTADMWNSI